MKSAPASTRIVITHHPCISTEDLNPLREELGLCSNDVQVVARDVGPQAALSWILPTLLGIWVGREVASGFFRELGASGAKRIKELLASLFHKAKNNKARWITPSSSRGTPVSPISITCTPVDRRADLKFVFPANLSKTAFREALEQIGRMHANALVQGASTDTSRVTYVYNPKVSAWLRPDLPAPAVRSETAERQTKRAKKKQKLNL
jgi:hypothetical protein